MHSQPPTPTPAADSGQTRTVAADDRLSAELTSVVAGARRRALRDGDRQIDTAHLLHSLLETDPAVRALFDGGQVARLLGYLVQRSIGYGLQWQGAVEDSGALPVVREVAGWSPSAATAMEAALATADRRGARQVGGVDLLLALARDPECRAVEVLRRAGVDAEALAAQAHPTGS
ncbi:Clp protease N-terminal domain-containing protein [Streptomyces sp. B-S-A6]|uniref:Clp protease N-terminal domain-containing protein n=1 Tax=Streptomyces cavernicola TaxID=3043613 RepID=A0ABT6SH34_9ACTN|nr:Clp protease N-terminal domain-containing protein [Streptomyces sp. B-S-A6]MDI3407510.1 Clp protease N-terminal domain-containing protein [Streptomyces sp. B-S-A6]